MPIPDFTPVRLDREPIILAGCTSNEIRGLMLAASIIGVLAGLILWAITGVWPIIFALPALSIGLSLTAGARFLATLKRAKPLRYHSIRVAQWLHRHAGVTPLFINHDGHWDTYRHGA